MRSQSSRFHAQTSSGAAPGEGRLRSAQLPRQVGLLGLVTAVVACGHLGIDLGSKDGVGLGPDGTVGAPAGAPGADGGTGAGSRGPTTGSGGVPQGASGGSGASGGAALGSGGGLASSGGTGASGGDSGGSAGKNSGGRNSGGTNSGGGGLEGSGAGGVAVGGAGGGGGGASGGSGGTLGSGGSGVGASGGGSGGSGGSGGGAIEDCNSGVFTNLRVLAGLGHSGTKWGPSVTLDGLVLYFSSVDSGSTDEKLYRAIRSDRASDFGTAVEVSEISDYPADPGGWSEATPFVNPDDSRVYFARQEGSDQTTQTLWVAERPGPGQPFSRFEELGELDAPGRDHLPWLGRDELSIYFSSSRGSTWATNIWTASRASVDAPFDPPLTSTTGALATSQSEDGSPSLSPDGLTAFITSDRGSGDDFDIYSSFRASTTGSFISPVPVAELNSPADELHVRLSPDGRDIYFASDRTGTMELYVATRCP